MSNQDSTYLIEQLLNNTLSGAELDAFLAGLTTHADRLAYSDVLESYFQELINNQHPPPDADQLAA